MNNRISVATIDKPEFINLQPMDQSPLMSKCEIKVLYIGQNRNKSAITKEVATNMSKTLRGCPIVGYYINNKEDFGDHGDQVIIDGEGVKFNTLTKPYGFVAPDAKVWFQFFEDQDEFGNICLREYLMTEGYLWTEQFPECKRVLTNNNPQSMELDDKNLKGHWATDNNSGVEFFIINDAIFSKLCILGDDVEPCFEGANISAPNISSSFDKDDSFTKSLFQMMEELKFALKKDKGGLSMEDVLNSGVETEVEATEGQAVENSFAEQDKSSELEMTENENTVGEFAKKEEEQGEKENNASDTKESDSEKDDDKEDEDEEEKKPATKNSLEINVDIEKLQSELVELQNKYSSLEEENKKLLEFKKEIENKQKDDLINSFYMLSDEDKKNVIDNKDKYSLDDIEKELSVICVRKKVSFDLLENDDNKDNNSAISTVFNLDSHQADSLPAWLKVVEDIRNNED